MPFRESMPFSPLATFVRTGMTRDQPFFLCSSFIRLACESCPPPQSRVVSFTDSESVRHAVEVSAKSLYEARYWLRRCGFTANAPGPATRLTDSVKTPATSHVRMSKSGGRSPNEQAMMIRLREALRDGDLRMGHLCSVISFR